MEDEYSSDISSFIGGNNIKQEQNKQIFSQQPYNPQIPIMEQQAQQVYQQPVYHQQGQPIYHQPQASMNNDYRYLKPMEHFGNKFNTKENVLSVLVIVILFMVFASHNFRRLIGGLSFLNMVNGDYNLTSLFAMGLVFAIIYTSLKIFIF